MSRLTGVMMTSKVMDFRLTILRFGYFTPLHVFAELLFGLCEKERALARIKGRLVLRKNPEKCALPIAPNGFNCWEQGFGEQIIEPGKSKACTVMFALWPFLFVTSQTAPQRPDDHAILIGSLVIKLSFQ